MDVAADATVSPLRAKAPLEKITKGFDELIYRE